MQKIWAAVAIVACITLTSCVAQPQKPYIAKRTEGEKIGVINLMPNAMFHNYYGALAGLSQRHTLYAAPFNVGQELAKQISAKIVSTGQFQSVVITAPAELKATAFDPKRAYEENYEWPKLWFDIDKPLLSDHANFNVNPGFIPLFTALAKQYKVTSFIVIMSRNETPGGDQQYAPPPGLSYGVHTKSHGIFSISHTLLATGCFAFDLERLSVEKICDNNNNAIRMEDYKEPESGKEPLPRMDEITRNLRTLIDIRANTVLANFMAPQ